MAKKKSKITPLFPRVNPGEMTRKTFESLVNQRINPKYHYADIDLETDFGVLKMRECDFHDTIYGDNMPIVFNYDDITVATKEKNTIELVVLLEKAIDRHPKAIIFYLQLISAYRTLKKFDKTDEIIIRNYKVNKGLPVIDIGFMELGKKANTAEYTFLYDNELYNIHDVYPMQERFHNFEILEFYRHLGDCAINSKNILLAESCIKVVEKVDTQSFESIYLRTALDKIKNPYRYNLKSFVIIAVLLGIVGLIVWGIYRFFAWIF
jgi:hypothetical protein